MKPFKITCLKLNKILENRPERRDDFIKALNTIIHNEAFNCSGGLYWNRELFIYCRANTDLCRRMIYTYKVMFIPSDDQVEHSGITLIYKPGFNR